MLTTPGTVAYCGMWPFSPRRKPDLSLEIRLDKLERSMKDIELEWADKYDKFHRLYLRLQKRAKADEKAAEDGSGPTNGDTPNPTTNPLAERLLHPYGRYP